MSFFFRLAAKFFLYLALLSPLVLAPALFFPFINGKVLLFRVGVTLAWLFYLGALLTGKTSPEPGLVRQPLFWSVIVFGLIFVVTALTGIAPAGSFWSNFERGEGAFQVLHYIAFFTLTSLLFRTKTEWRRLLIFASAVSLLVLGYGLSQRLAEFGIGHWTINVGHRISGTLGNPSYLSAYLLFHFVFAIWLFRQTYQTGWKWLWGGLLLLQMTMVFLTETLAAIISLIFAVMALIGFYVVKIYRLSLTDGKNKFFFYACYVGSFLIVSLAAWSFYSFGQINLYDRLKPRLWTWGSAWQGIQENPWLGWGAENFAHVFDRYHNPLHFGGEAWFDRTHNLFLEYLIAGGVLLFIAYLAIFFFYYKRLFVLPRDWLWPVFFVAPLVYFLQGLTLFDVLPVYLALFLLLAFFLHYSNNFDLAAAERRPLPGWWTAFPVIGWSISGLLAVGLLWLLYFGTYLPLRKNLLLAEALRASEITEVVKKFEQTLSFNSPVGQQETYESFAKTIATFFEGLIKQGQTVDPKTEGFKVVTEMHDRWFAEVRPRLIGIKDLYLNGIFNFMAYRLSKEPSYREKAKTILGEARQLAPKRMEVILALLEIARNEGNGEAEAALLNDIKTLRPDLLSRVGG